MDGNTEKNRSKKGFLKKLLSFFAVAGSIFLVIFLVVAPLFMSRIGSEMWVAFFSVLVLVYFLRSYLKSPFKKMVDYRYGKDAEIANDDMESGKSEKTDGHES